MTNYFSISAYTAQTTIILMRIGFAIGQLIFGFLSDMFGRYKTVIFSLVIYIVAIILLICSKSVLVLLISRFVQGIMCGSFAVNSRAIAIDKFKEHNLKTVIVYLSLAWGIGPIIAPYVGGILATYLNWQAIFIVMTIYATTLLITAMRVIDKHNDNSKSLMSHIYKSKEIITNSEFVFRTIILGLCFSQSIIFNIVGPFWTIRIFEEAPNVFGTAALIAGLGYFSGTLFNKFLINKVTCNKLISLGLIIGGIGAGVLSLNSYESIYEIAVIIGVINFGTGFIFANIMAENMMRFNSCGGVFSALQGSLLMAVGFCVAFLVSILKYPSISNIGEVFFVITLAEIMLFILVNHYKKCNTIRNY